MLCLRCGQCCLNLDIFVVNPSSILEDGCIDPDDSQAMIHKPAGRECPHLSHNTGREGSLAVCAIHHLPCYLGSPCERFEQIGPMDAVCVMSGYFKGLHEKIR